MSDHEKIRKVFEEIYAENVQNKNLQGYGEMYTDDALWMPPDTCDRRGRADIVEGFSATIADQDIYPNFRADEVEVIGEFGYVVGISNATIKPSDGSPAKQIRFRALWLMKKERDQWKIYRQIWNKKLP